MPDVIVHDGRKYVALDYVLAVLQGAEDRPNTHLSFAQAFTIGARGSVWFKEGWRKCAEQIRDRLASV